MRLPVRNCLALVIGLALFGVVDEPGLAAERVEFKGNLGIGYDLTNQIYFEQTFDSTAFTGRRTISDLQGRLQGLADALLRVDYAGGSLLRVENRLSGGEKLVRNLLYVDWKHRLTRSWGLLLRSDLGYRRDSSFGHLQKDIRESALIGVEKRTGDLASAWRLDYRFDLAENRTSQGFSFYPDYRYHRLSLGYDHFRWTGPEWGIRYTIGYRSFPDTSVRNYIDHALDSRFRVRSTSGVELELRGLVDRRSAHEAEALGDRYLYGEADVRFRVPLVRERWFAEILGGVVGTSYDNPAAAYFHNAVPRAEVNLRFESFPHWTVTTRLMTEILRVPDGGGLGDVKIDPDAINAAREEYQQGAMQLDIERLGNRTWFFLSPSFGRRSFRIGSRVETDLLARSSYWFAQLGSFAEARLGPVLLLRLSLDVLHERHDIVSDDLTSIFAAAEIRYLLFP